MVHMITSFVDDPLHHVIISISLQNIESVWDIIKSLKCNNI